MSATATITFRTDPGLKADVEAILADIGLNLSTAFNCFMKKVRAVEGIPFALSHRGKHRRLLAAMEEAKREAKSPNAKFCDDPKKLKEFLLS